MFTPSVSRFAHLSLTGAALALALCLPVSAVHAQGTTVLTFDFAPGAGVTDGTLVPQAYGDNVTAATMGNFSYGGTSPFTPNITTLYSGGSIGPSFWSTGYGDLTNVIRGEPNQLLLVTFSPAAGTSITLNSFDLAGFFGQDYLINSVKVFTGGGAPPFSVNNFNVRGTGTPAHSSFTFSGITSTTFLTIQIDALNLGAVSSNIGIDNISFTQTPLSTAAPEPGALALIGTAILPLGIIVRRRARIR